MENNDSENDDFFNTDSFELSQTENSGFSQNANSEPSRAKNKNSQTDDDDEEEPKKKLPFPLRLLKGIFTIVVILLILLLGWVCFSAFDRAEPLEFLPENYTAVVHTDSIFEAAAPIVELKAADTLLAEPSLAAFRGAFMQARDFFNNSNFFVNKILSRRVDLAFYPEQENNFVAIIDLSYLSAATRLLNIAAGFTDLQNLPLNIKALKNLSYKEKNYFEYNSDGTIFYIKLYKNLAIVSLSKSLFLEAIAGGKLPTEEEKDLIEGEKTKSIKIVANARKITKSFENETVAEVVPLIKKDALTSVVFSLSNDDIELQMKLPLSLENENSPVAGILQKTSTLPKMLSTLTSETQYYTMLNIGSLAQAKDAAFQIARKTQDVDGIWKKANSYCKNFLSLSLEDILFSWTGSECAVFGIEGSSEPVFALQIADENQRREIFKKLEDSILLNINTNLIVGGVRLPCFELPQLLAGLLSLFKINLPRPYYLVQSGFVFFSLAPQNLSAIHAHIKNNYVIAQNENWQRVSQKGGSNSSVGIFYNLNRSLPFFIENASILAKILRLYEIGRCNIAFAENTIDIKLNASSVLKEDSKQVPGFPIATGKPKNFALYADSQTKTQNVFWLENETTIKALNLDSLEQRSFETQEPCRLCAAQSKKNDGGVLWAVTSGGSVYLLNKNLECVENFPIVTGEKINVEGAVYDNGLALPTASGKILHINEKGGVQKIAIIPDANFRAAPSVCEKTMAIYNRGFEGEIYIFENGALKNADAPMLVDGIGFGAPCITNNGKKTQVAFITQAGTFYLFEENKLVEGFPIEIDDVFFTNAVYRDGAFFALSQNAILYKIFLDGTYDGVKLPNTASAKEGIITVLDGEKKPGVYVSGDDNILYGFDSNLELLISFPVIGRGVPVFADANNDKKTDCLALSMNRELNAWNVKQ